MGWAIYSQDLIQVVPCGTLRRGVPDELRGPHYMLRLDQKIKACSISGPWSMHFKKQKKALPFSMLWQIKRWYMATIEWQHQRSITINFLSLAYFLTTFFLVQSEVHHMVSFDALDKDLTTRTFDSCFPLFSKGDWWDETARSSISSGIASKIIPNLPILRINHEFKGIIVNMGRIHREFRNFQKIF